MKRLGKLIANWRWAEKLTVRDAAEMIGLTPSTYSRLERGYSVDGGTLAIVLTWQLQAARSRRMGSAGAAYHEGRSEACRKS